MDHCSQAYIFQVIPARGSSSSLSLFSRQFGRVWCYTTKPRELLSTFSLVEAVFHMKPDGRMSAYQLEIIDTFAEIRAHQSFALGVLWLKRLIDFLPVGCPFPFLWDTFSTLFSRITDFVDWKAVVLLFSLMLFEHEGIDLQELASHPQLSKEAQAIARQLVSLDEAGWCQVVIPQDLFEAVLESVGVENAKGGT